MYAAALASLVCALLCAGGARIAPFWCRYRILQWALALFALWPLTQSLARMGLFPAEHRVSGPPALEPYSASYRVYAPDRHDRFEPVRHVGAAVAWAAGAVLALSGILTLGELRISYWEAPAAPLLGQAGAILRALLPAALALSLALPDGLAGAASRGLSAGGTLLALLSLRALLLLGPHTAALLPYPNFSAAGLAAIGDFARHGEVFFAVPLLLCELGRCAALACVLLLPVTHSYGVLRLGQEADRPAHRQQ